MSMRSNICPCCGDSLLRHVRHGEFYWFCQTCRQEVPLLSTSIHLLSSTEKSVLETRI
jgi:ribosomal protein L37AE/L43A